MIDRINGRLALLLGIAGLLVLVLAGWFMLVSPQKSKAAALDTQIDDASVQLTTTQTFLVRNPPREGRIRPKNAHATARATHAPRVCDAASATPHPAAATSAARRQPGPAPGWHATPAATGPRSSASAAR